jgi:hypothetical protein
MKIENLLARQVLGVRAPGAAMNIVWKHPLYEMAESRGTQAAHLSTLSGLSALDLKRF